MTSPATPSTPPNLPTTPALVVDCRGRPCPIPVIELARAVLTVAVGALVEVWSDDPAARYDIPAWCGLREQDYAGARPLTDAERGDQGAGPGPAAYLVRRRT